MKKLIKVLGAIIFIGINVNLQVAEATNYDIKDEFTFSATHNFPIVKHDDKAKDKLAELKKTFDEVADVELVLEKTGSEGLDIFMAYYTGEQAEALNEIYWNIHDPTYESYWNSLVDDLRLISRHIKQDVGTYYGVGISIDVSGQDEILLLVTGGYVMDDKVNPVNYEPDYINQFE